MILVGEMRDLETIGTALHAAETGHMVFSTLHTLDAAEPLTASSRLPAARAETDSPAACGCAEGHRQPAPGAAFGR